jgi:glycosyltransferase involved in cell wall biosynthesis
VKTILIISFSDLKNDPRVNRQIQFLKDSYRVIAAGTEDPELPGVEFISCKLQFPRKNLRSRVAKAALIRLLLCLKQYDQFYWIPGDKTLILDKLSPLQPDLIIANDLKPLPIALRLAKFRNAKVLFDAHEYTPRQYENLLRWKILQPYYKYLCSKFIPQVHGMMTVNQTIADEYEKDTGVKPVIVTNAPVYHKIEPCFRSHDEQYIRLIHHGGASRSRKLQNMIKMMEYLDDRFLLDFLLVGNPAYVQELQQQARGDSRIRFLSPVPMKELVTFSNQYDIGVFLVEPVNFNLRYTLPNKLFEFIQARLAIAIGPSPEMARIVRDYDCGVVSEDFSPRSLAKQLMKLNHSQINYYKQQSHKAAQILSAEQNRKILLDLVEDIL